MADSLGRALWPGGFCGTELEPGPQAGAGVDRPGPQMQECRVWPWRPAAWTQEHLPPSASSHDPCAGRSLEEETGWEKPLEKPPPHSLRVTPLERASRGTHGGGGPRRGLSVQPVQWVVGLEPGDPGTALAATPLRCCLNAAASLLTAHRGGS